MKHVYREPAFPIDHSQPDRSQWIYFVIPTEDEARELEKQLPKHLRTSTIHYYF